MQNTGAQNSSSWIPAKKLHTPATIRRLWSTNQPRYARRTCESRKSLIMERTHYSPRRLCKLSCSFTTRPLSLTSTPCHVLSSASVPQLSLRVQLAPLVEMNSATSASRSVEATGTYRVCNGAPQPARNRHYAWQNGEHIRARWYHNRLPTLSFVADETLETVGLQTIVGKWYFVDMVSVGVFVRDGLTRAVSVSHQCDFWLADWC